MECLMWAIAGTEKFTDKPKFAHNAARKPYLFFDQSGAIDEIEIYRRNQVNHLYTVNPKPVRVRVIVEAADD